MKTKCFLVVFLCFLLAACGYQWQNTGSPSGHSVLGDGSRTLKIIQVEQAPLSPDLPYIVRSILRDEINLRKLARWVDTDDADYNMVVRVPLFEMRAFTSDVESITLINSARMDLELLVYDNAKGSLAWRSGTISYSERYGNPSAHTIERTMLIQVINRALDRMQQSF